MNRIESENDHKLNNLNWNHFKNFNDFKHWMENSRIESFLKLNTFQL